MKNTFAIIMLIALVSASCKSTLASIFGNKTAREQYEDKLDDKDLDKTPIGRQWLAASKTALEDPQTVQMPYKHIGYFQLDKPRALGLKFNAKRGEQLTFTITKKESSNFVLFADLFKQDGSETALLLSADTATSQFQYAIDEAGSYVLRLQPELFRTGEYTLSVSVGPSLHFPVGANKGKIGSFWGASRDGGKRSHEGVDIFAPKGTPAVASADGIVTGVKEAGIGGKVVWLRPLDRNITLYYAHLDKQLVREGQQVKKGEVLGTVGNTGNAKHTPSHLHFGVYTSSGPIDPLPFVQQTTKNPAAVASKPLNNYLRLTKTQKLGEAGSVKANTLLVPLAVTAKGYIAELPEGRIISTPFASVQTTTQAINNTGVIATSDGNRKVRGARL